MRSPSTTSSTGWFGVVTTSRRRSAAGCDPVPDLRERVLYPRAGWLSLGLLVIMGLALTWAVQGAHWLDQLEFLPPVAFWAILTGALLGVLPLRVVFTLPLSAIIG